MIEIDGSQYSGSGTIVRQSVALSALTGQSVHIVNARQRRTRPGLRRQHVRAVEAVRDLANGVIDGCHEGSTELTFHPGVGLESREHHWDIGSAGSTTMLALATLPVLALSSAPAEAVIEGGLFQDSAPTYFHLRHVLIPLLQRMGFDANMEMVRPGYVPSGGGIIRLVTKPSPGPLRPLIHDDRGDLERIWGIAFSSRLRERRVSQRMADAARRVLLAGGYAAQIETMEEDMALQQGAALAVFADFTGGARLGADRVGATRRSSEAIGEYAAQCLLEELATDATLDRYAADQVITFAALADGESRFRIPMATDHVMASAWLVHEFLGAEVEIEGSLMTVKGVGLEPRHRKAA